MGSYAQAEPLYHQALEIRKKALGALHPNYATSLNNLANFYWSRAAYARAEPLYHQALEIEKKALGEQHPDYAATLTSLAALYVAKGEPSRAERLSLLAVQAIRTVLDRTAPVQTERQQFLLSSASRHHLDLYLTASSAGSDPGAGYAEVLAWKGAVSARQRLLRALRQARQAENAETRQTAAQLTDATCRLARLSKAAQSNESIDRRVEELRAAQKDVEQLERKLCDACPEFAARWREGRGTTADIRQTLPASTALVDLIEYDHRLAGLTKGKPRFERRIAAFVIRRDQPAKRVDLGQAQAIGDCVDRWRQRFGSGPDALAESSPASELRRRVWEPLAPYLEGNSTVLVSPDGALNRFPLAALPGKKPGSYLIEDVAVAVIPVPQLLPELLAEDKPVGHEPLSLLVVGNVDYGSLPTGAVTRSYYGPLPGTEGEASMVQKRFRAVHPKGNVDDLEEAEATKEAVTKAMCRARWLHMAVHGTYAGDKALALAGTIRREETRLGAPAAVTERSTAVDLPPELLSGLVFAGANQPTSEDPARGILTALEVEELDLHELDTAVLSACNTACGKEASGEGVLGLQRAFQVAGARTVVASLWPVPDRQTRDLMEAFYQKLWSKHGSQVSKLEALRQAQLEMIRTGPRRGLVPDESDERKLPDKSPPYYWAAFVLSGDWR